MITEKLFLNDKPINENTVDELVAEIQALFEHTRMLENNNRQLQGILKAMQMKQQLKEGPKNEIQSNDTGNPVTKAGDKEAG